MQKNSLTNKISPCCSLPFSVVYWWVSNLTLNSDADREFIISKISQNGAISIEGWKVLANSATLESDASFNRATLLGWFDCGRQPSCEQLKMIIEGLVIGNWTPEIEDEIIDLINVRFSELNGMVALDLAKKFDKAGGKISGRTSIGVDLPASQDFNVFNQIKILKDELKSVIIGEGVNSAGAKLYQIHENYTWTVPSYNAGMIGMYADLYLHQVASAASTVVANESYVNMSMAEGVTNAGRSIGYLGGVMVMSGHKGRIDNASGAQIINRIRPSAAGIVGSMSGVQAGLTAYDTNTTAMGEFRAFENLLFPLRGATIQDVYGMYLNPSKITGVTRGWGVYQSSIEDVNHFAGKVRIGYVLGTDIPDSTYMVDVRGSVRISEGVEVGGFNNLGNTNVRKLAPEAGSATNYLVNNSLRWTLDFGGAENGNISGSNLTMYRYADDGSYLGMLYNLSRATGEMEIGENLKAKKVQLKTATLDPEPASGLLEYDGTDLYFTGGGTRKKVGANGASASVIQAANQADAIALSAANPNNIYFW